MTEPNATTMTDEQISAIPLTRTDADRTPDPAELEAVMKPMDYRYHFVDCEDGQIITGFRRGGQDVGFLEHALMRRSTIRPSRSISSSSARRRR